MCCALGLTAAFRSRLFLSLSAGCHGCSLTLVRPAEGVQGRLLGLYPGLTILRVLRICHLAIYLVFVLDPSIVGIRKAKKATGHSPTHASAGCRTMWSRFLWKTPVYQNTGSTARDHLASERTFLAWIRTGLGFLALGIAIERFSQLDLKELLKPVREKRQSGQQVRSSEDLDPDEIEHQLEKEQSQVLVGTLMALGSGSIVYGTSRYFSNLRLLQMGLFKPAYHGSALLAASVAGLAGGVYGSALRRRWAAKNEQQEIRGSP